jgi:hypothetical protein
MIILFLTVAKQLRALPSKELSVTSRERTSETYDDIYDLPDETTAVQYRQQTVDDRNGYERPYQGIKDLPSPSVDYEPINCTTYDALSSTIYDNDAGQAVFTQSYLSLLADEDAVEYVSSKTYSEVNHLTRAPAANQTQTQWRT